MLDPNKHRSVLDVGCGLGTESIFLARVGWNGAVFGIDTDDEPLEKARERALEHRVRAYFKQTDFTYRQGLPASWPRKFGIVLDRLVINNFVDGEHTLREYFERMAELVEPGGRLVVRDRESSDLADKTFRRLLFSPIRDDDFFGSSDGERFFKPLGPIVRARLVGDDTDDETRLDAMIPVRGSLAVLERRRGRRS